MLLLDEDDPRRLVWQKCESPIEQLLCAGIFAFIGCQSVVGPFDERRLPAMAELILEPRVFLFSQHIVKPYRADFLLVAVNPQTRKAKQLILECDGRAYHSTHEQVRRDIERDAFIASKGYTIMRFTGAELRGSIMHSIDKIASWCWVAGVHRQEPPELQIIRMFTPKLEPIVREREPRDESYREFELEDGSKARWADTL